MDEARLEVTAAVEAPVPQHQSAGEVPVVGQQVTAAVEAPVPQFAEKHDSSNSAFRSGGKRVLLEFARRMLPSDAPLQGRSNMLGVRVLVNVDPMMLLATSTPR
ncbi:hypothetical protein CYMTET_6127 [Cymbomonas tetramitiformis]|uniref:Uncharacterized protein n=1 Tax=Cymbomonas tetramitiformis TaxID=36881 RepID=A0AAE0GXS8_9CHLO|nr:hypothetical protein CYMTET_6127 [Cymbomonas tetramitiformis]